MKSKKILMLSPMFLLASTLSSCGGSTKVRVVFNPDYEGGAVSVVEVDKGKTVSQPTAPTRDGYTFSGWKVSTDDSSNAYDFNNKVDKDIVLYGSWVLGEPIEKELTEEEALNFVKDTYQLENYSGIYSDKYGFEWDRSETEWGDTSGTKPYYNSLAFKKTVSMLGTSYTEEMGKSESGNVITTKKRAFSFIANTDFLKALKTDHSTLKYELTSTKKLKITGSNLQPIIGGEMLTLPAKVATIQFNEKGYPVDYTFTIDYSGEADLPAEGKQQVEVKGLIKYTIINYGDLIK